MVCHISGMSIAADLSRASREELLAIIAELDAANAALRSRVERLEAQLSGRGGPRGMPGNKPGSGSGPPSERKPRQPRIQGFARRRMEPTDRVEHAVDVCPDCGTELSGGWTQRTREVIDIPESAVRVTEHAVIARECPVCRKRRVPRLELGDEVLGRQRLGVNVLSLVSSLREEGRLPIRTIRWYLRSVHGLELSEGAIVDVVHRVGARAREALGEVLDRIRASPVVGADETGWRQDGENGYVWTFNTPTERYFVRGSRRKEMVDDVLGDGFAGVLVSDFYAAYDHYPGLKQRCWAHLLREVHDLKTQHPDDVELSRWAAKVKDVYTRSTAFRHRDPRKRYAAQRRFEERLLALCRPYADDPSAVQGKLCRRIVRSVEQLFVFVGEPRVPPDNNGSERSLRHLVISRKVSGGTRSVRGTESKMALASLFGTWRARNLNPLLACRRMLLSPQL